MAVGQLLLLALEVGDLHVDRADLVLDGLLALQRRAREVLITRGQRLARLPVELDDLLPQAVLLVLQPLARGRHLGNPVLDVRHQLELLLIAVVQRLRRILGAIQRRRGLRLHQGAKPSPKSGHHISSRPAPSDTRPVTDEPARGAHCPAPVTRSMIGRTRSR